MYVCMSYMLLRHMCLHMSIECIIRAQNKLRMDIVKSTEMSCLAYSILLAQLITTLIHCPCTVALTGLADWSAFLELVLPIM